MQKGRVLTIRVVIENEEESKQIWQAAGGHCLLAGCKVRALADGDLFKERNFYKYVADAGVEEDVAYQTLNDDEPNEVKTECGKTFYQHPFGVFSEHSEHYDEGEAFETYDDLKKKYKVKDEPTNGE